MKEEYMTKNARTMAIFLVVFLFASAIGCGEKYADRMKRIMDSWLGSDISDVIANWGPPSQVTDIGNGNKIYSWTSSSTSTYFYPATQYSKAHAENYTSEKSRSFWVNSDGKVYKWA
jgi:hypothetical protein